MKDITERLAKVGERVGIPCPDGIKGCAVFHFRVLTDPVCLEAIDEIKRLREALREITSADIQCWAMVALTNPDPKAWRDMLEQIAQYDMQKIAINALIERKE